jgi:hypothetical protein
MLHKKYYRDDKMKESETEGACRNHGKAVKCAKIAFGRYKNDFEGSSSCCQYLTKRKKQNKFRVSINFATTNLYQQ